jgi:hypothetical protein
VIKETMTSLERIEAAVNLQTPDRVPVAPLFVQFPLRYQGLPQIIGYRDPIKTIDAMTATFDALGGYDGIIAPDFIWPSSSWRTSMAPTPMHRDYGESDHSGPIQAAEQEIMSFEDYDIIINHGWNKFCEELLPRVTKRSLDQLDAGQKKLLKYYISDTKVWMNRGAVVLFGACTLSCMMILSLCRSLTKFTLDLHRHPDKVQAAMDAMYPDLIDNVVKDIEATGIPWVFFPMERDSTFYYPLKTFERFSMPYLKKMTDAFISKGYRCVLHCDNNWTQNLPYFKELPKGKCICELDGTTNIFKAKEILQNHMCIMGDVPASILALGTPGDVTVYCEKLIDIVGAGGGFILSTGCECPIDAKYENVRAMIDAPKKHAAPSK